MSAQDRKTDVSPAVSPGGCKTPQECCECGVALAAGGDMAEAVEALENAVRLDPAFERPYMELARIMLKAANAEKAFQYLFQAIRSVPDSSGCREEFLSLIEDRDFIDFSPLTKEMTSVCLRSEGICYERLRKIWLNYTKIDPGLRRLYKLAAMKSYGIFKVQVLDKYPEFLDDPFFRRGLRDFVIPDMDMEKFLTRLRRLFLERITDNRLDFRIEPILAGDLANYCYYTGYIFRETPEEQVAVEHLKSRLERHPESATVQEISLYAAYRPLSSLTSSGELSSLFAGNERISSLIATQIDEERETERLEKTIAVAAGRHPSEG